MRGVHVCYTWVMYYYLTINKGLLVLLSVLGWLSLHPQQAHRVPSVALEAKGTAVTRQAPRFPEEKDPCQPQRRAVTRQAPLFPQEKDPCRSQRSPPSPGPAARHVGSRARRHLVAPEGWWRAGRGPGGEGRWHWYREKHKYCRVL